MAKGRKQAQDDGEGERVPVDEEGERGRVDGRRKRGDDKPMTTETAKEPASTDGGQAHNSVHVGLASTKGIRSLPVRPCGPHHGCVIFIK